MDEQSDPDLAWELIDRAEDLPHGEMQVQVAEEAVRVADASRDEETMFAARLCLVQAAAFGGAREQVLVAFSWCLARYRENRDDYDRFSYILNWYFKYALHGIDEFPNVATEQTEDLLEQMSQCYQESGYSTRPVHYLRFCLWRKAGFTNLADLFEKWKNEPRDSMADCIACEADEEIEYYESIGEFEKAVDFAQPNLRGDRTCAEVPHRTFAYVLRPLSLLDRHDEADECHETGYRMIRNNPSFLRQVALHIVFLLHRGNRPKAVELFERHLRWALETREIRSRHFFYSAARRLMRELKTDSATRQMRLPNSFELFSKSSSYDLTQLTDWFDRQVETVGAQFNQRNGNDFYTSGLVDTLEY
ncbi:MAG: hypothetical protein QGG36_06280 [Pirellulaceae bacterium]|jgi:tetratricopeptide (TPR) repeat protein|nr:hypothetical protein [Pirellulaceae bacterium]